MNKFFIISQLFLIGFFQINCSLENKQKLKKFTKATLIKYSLENQLPINHPKIEEYKRSNQNEIDIHLYKDQKEHTFWGYMYIKETNRHVDNHSTEICFTEEEIKHLKLMTFCKKLTRQTAENNRKYFYQIQEEIKHF